MRIDRYIADSSFTTRKTARDMIKSGRVSVNGEVVKDISFHIRENDRIEIDGKTSKREEFIYIMLNKPKGVLSASTDKNKKTVTDLLPEKYKRYKLFPMGRLDKDTEGLLILTNDGQTAHKCLSPKYHVKKVYFARLDGDLKNEDAEKIENGIDIGGYTTKEAKLRKILPNEWEITICEGKFHQVKRMFEAVGRKVTYLKRISFAEIPLDEDLKTGDFRPLTDVETALLH